MDAKALAAVSYAQHGRWQHAHMHVLYACSIIISAVNRL